MSNLKNNIKAMLVDVSKRNIFFRKIFRSLLLTKNKMQYSKYKRKYKTDENTILFENSGKV